MRHTARLVALTLAGLLVGYCFLDWFNTREFKDVVAQSPNTREVGIFKLTVKEQEHFDSACVHLQARLHQLQFKLGQPIQAPSAQGKNTFLHSPRRVLVCGVQRNCGFGCIVHRAIHCLHAALVRNRTFVWVAAGQPYTLASSESCVGWNCLFQPLHDLQLDTPATRYEACEKAIERQATFLRAQEHDVATLYVDGNFIQTYQAPKTLPMPYQDMLSFLHPTTMRMCWHGFFFAHLSQLSCLWMNKGLHITLLPFAFIPLLQTSAQARKPP
eukprot:m.8115 g.8115  ORF g.8115 m.8115 type:complete len:271 (-) comp5320_c0_seq2:961-1773(-)